MMNRIARVPILESQLTALVEINLARIVRLALKSNTDCSIRKPIQKKKKKKNVILSVQLIPLTHILQYVRIFHWEARQVFGWMLIGSVIGGEKRLVSEGRIVPNSSQHLPLVIQCRSICWTRVFLDSMGRNSNVERAPKMTRNMQFENEGPSCALGVCIF